VDPDSFQGSLQGEPLYVERSWLVRRRSCWPIEKGTGLDSLEENGEPLLDCGNLKDRMNQYHGILETRDYGIGD